MNITIPFNEFFRLISHEVACNGVCLINYPSLLEAIQLSDPDCEYCFIDWSQGPPMLYTTQGWIQECKRRKEIDSVLETVREERAKQPMNNLEKVRQLDPALAALLEQQLKGLQL